MRRSILAAAAATALAGLALAGTASAQTTIQPGQTINGQLTSRDPVWDQDNTPMDCYVLQTQAGQSYVIDYRSDAFDAFLAVGPGRNCQGAGHTAFDDDSGGGLHSRLTLAGDGQVWFIRANAISVGSNGAYTLAVSGGGNGPQRPVGKPPAGGGGAANTPAPSDDELSDEESIFGYLAVCMAADIAESKLGVPDTDARTQDSMMIFQMMMLAAEDAGVTEEDMTDIVGTLVAAWDDPETQRANPPGAMRQTCLETIRSLGE